MLVADPQSKVLIEARGRTTVLLSVQVWPPIFRTKLAVPPPEGVPVMEYVSEPLPLENNPALMLAVRPVTPVEETLCEA